MVVESKTPHNMKTIKPFEVKISENQMCIRDRYKVGNSALINTDIFEMYLEKFKEPTRPLPKHIWNKLSSEDKKDHNSCLLYTSRCV